MGKYLTILAILITGSGCCNQIPVTIDLPPRPDLIVIEQGVWVRIPPEAQDAMTHNDLALKEYARRLEVRIAVHNESQE